MPLSAFQQSILRLLAQNRSPESYVAGATVLHQIPDSPRFSDDLDMFHDVEDSVARSAAFDVAVSRWERCVGRPVGKIKDIRRISCSTS